MEENDINKNDALMQFIKDTDKQPTNQIPINPNTEFIGQNVRQKVDKIETVSEWMELPLATLPYSKFYLDGTRIMMRPLKTIEIQNFSTVNEDNPFDVQTKLTEVFKTCIKFINPDGSVGSYRDLMSGDRETIAITLAKISAKNGRKIEHTVKTINGDEVKLEMIPKNFVYRQPDEFIEQFFNIETKVYEFVNQEDRSEVISLAPPTIGLEEDMNNYVLYVSAKSGGKEFPSLSFVTTLPYMKAGKKIKSIPLENMEQELFNFTKMSDDYFTIIDDAINYFNFGIEKLRTVLSTGEVVEAPFRYPKGPRALFIVPNALKQFVRQ